MFHVMNQNALTTRLLPSDLPAADRAAEEDHGERVPAAPLAAPRRRRRDAAAAGGSLEPPLPAGEGGETGPGENDRLYFIYIYTYIYMYVYNIFMAVLYMYIHMYIYHIYIYNIYIYLSVL